MCKGHYIEQVEFSMASRPLNKLQNSKQIKLNSSPTERLRGVSSWWVIHVVTLDGSTHVTTLRLVECSESSNAQLDDKSPDRKVRNGFF